MSANSSHPTFNARNLVGSFNAVSPATAADITSHRILVCGFGDYHIFFSFFKPKGKFRE
jgi:hypothetical protein